MSCLSDEPERDDLSGQVQDMINKIDNGTSSLNFESFCLVIGEKTKEMDLDTETHFKDTFRVFSKDEEGRN